ncbi:hypothetical protein [Vibrio methylphosphonaticus]|uniref:hypothetical protein n=1 Tax=Vibrio methylphosphonaticus TaxID=2946866 RepID=UPI00202AB5B1|nr:hypothetical protein [Vibrio methylphosphonaticus]MCL9773672.1 hypothetical protein [Vibrio methylphosphonaticus]
MRSGIFLLACIAITVWMIFDSGKSEQVLSLLSELSLGDVTMPSIDELGQYISEGFYYIALLIGVVYLGRKFKSQRRRQGS